MRSRYKVVDKSGQSMFTDQRLIDHRIINPNYNANVCKRNK